MVCISVLSLKKKAQEERGNVLKGCVKLLLALGGRSPRYCKLHGKGDPTDTMLSVQADAFFDSLQAKSVATHAKEVSYFRRLWKVVPF